MTVSLIKAIRAAANEADALEILRLAQDLDDRANADGGAPMVTEVTTVSLDGQPEQLGANMFAALAGPINMFLARMQGPVEQLRFWDGYFHTAMRALVDSNGLPAAQGMMLHLANCKEIEQAAPATHAPHGQQVH